MMHPALILIPAAALVIAPRWWVNRVLRAYDRDPGESGLAASQAAREMLDRHGLQAVAVEPTDSGDHYDPRDRAVRLSRDRFDRKTLTAVTTAAHEVAHALQHASGYPPFAWRMQLVSVARVTGIAGTSLLLAVPLVSLVTRQRLPPMVIGGAALATLGTGVAAQFSALPTELDASFRRALPMLRDGYVSAAQVADARRILVACSLTYVTSSLLGVVHIWPWLGRAPVFLRADPPKRAAGNRAREAAAATRRRTRRHIRGGVLESTVRAVARPLLRKWFELNAALR